jgi:hypothetical protein
LGGPIALRKPDAASSSFEYAHGTVRKAGDVAYDAAAKAGSVAYDATTAAATSARRAGDELMAKIKRD